LKSVSLLKIALLIGFASFSIQIDASQTLPAQKDSIAVWLKASKSSQYSSTQQKGYLYKAYKALTEKPQNHTKAANLSAIAYRYYQLKDTLNFKKINEETLNLALQLKDSFVIADAHWSYAEDLINREVYDQAYFHYNTAYLYFNGIQKEYESARMLYSMSFIKGRYRDYTGSEVLTIEAIKKFKKLNNYSFLYQSYNRLGLLQNDIQEYDKALFYHQKALKYLKKLNDKKNFYAWSTANIGLTYLEKGDYNKSIDFFNKALKNNNEIHVYARIIDSKYYAKLMIGDTTNVTKNFNRSLKIKDSLNDKSGMLITKIHLSDYYKYIKDTTRAYQYAKEANILAHRIKNGRDYLRSLEQLAEVDPKNAKGYLKRYIQYNDSLIAIERKVQNNFTRIDFETDEYIEETKRLSQQKIWILVTGAALMLILSLLYFLRIQKSKTEKLVLETEQQKANEQVYLLTIQQQSILEEERIKERNRISEELHDGILGRLFGTRVGLGFMSVEGPEATQEQHQNFLLELQEIEKEIRDVSHKLHSSFEGSEINFTTIIEQLLKDKSSQGEFSYQLQIHENISWKKINEVAKVHIYRMVQEALQNIIKHAQAKNVTLDFFIENAYLALCIEDDGNGFSTKKKKQGIGLKNMHSRVRKLKGDIQVTSDVAQGTMILIKIPM
jgi:signal transduction histidine kinase